MKKLLLITICIFMVLTFVSCSNNNNNSSYAIDEIISQKDGSIDSKAKSTTGKSTSEDKSNFKDKTIQKVILDFNGEISEIDYDTDAEKLIKEIKGCTNKPDVILSNKIGKMSVTDKEGNIIDIAEFYLASDYNVYAKDIEQNNDYAYKVDIDNFN